MEQHPVARWRAVHPRISRTRLAREIEISQPALLVIENGGGMSESTIRALVAATGRLRPGHGLTAGQILGVEAYDPGAAPADDTCPCGPGAVGGGDEAASERGEGECPQDPSAASAVATEEAA